MWDSTASVPDSTAKSWGEKAMVSPTRPFLVQVGHGGDVRLLVPEEGGGGQGQGADQQEGQHGGQSAPKKRKLFQGDDLLIEWMCP